MKKYPFHFYGDLQDVLGRCFWKKFCFSLYGDFSAVLEPPFAKNILSVSTEKRNGFCRGVFQKKHKKRAFVKTNPRGLSVF